MDTRFTPHIHFCTEKNEQVKTKQQCLIIQGNVQCS